MKIKDLVSGINKMLASGDFTPESDIAVAISTVRENFEGSVEFIDNVRLDWIWTDIVDKANFDKILLIKGIKEEK